MASARQFREDGFVLGRSPKRPSRSTASRLDPPIGGSSLREASRQLARSRHFPPHPEKINLIKIALEEDLGFGDITTDCLISDPLKAEAFIQAKQDLVLSGQKIAQSVFQTLDRKIKYQSHHKDGDFVSKGAKIATIRGKAAAVLKGERVALNFLQHLSGIATFTHKFVEAVKGTKVRIVDTRKTTPGLRLFEKQAVCHGGGANHRMGLFDRYLIKNNHIDWVGDIRRAIEKILKHKKRNILLEVEVRNFKELHIALQYPVDIILFDNFSAAQVRKATTLVQKKCKLEVSGGIHLKNVRDYAKTGVDFISVGALTHSAPAVDMHLIVSAN